jgi:hypothetical protein
VAAEGRGRAVLQSCANPQIHDRSKLARNLRRTVALAFLNLASSKPGLMLFRQTCGSGLARARAGTSDAAAPRQNPISQSCVADVRGPE